MCFYCKYHRIVQKYNINSFVYGYYLCIAYIYLRVENDKQYYDNITLTVALFNNYIRHISEDLPACIGIAIINENMPNSWYDFIPSDNFQNLEEDIKTSNAIISTK